MNQQNKKEQALQLDPDTGIFIDNIHKNVTSEYLYKFLQNRNFKNLNYIKYPVDRNTKKAKQYAFVYFKTKQDAIEAKNQLNHELILDQEIRIALIRNEQSKNNNNLFITNVNPNVSKRDFDLFFTKWGNVVSSKLQIDQEGKSLGYGYVLFEKVEDAQKLVNDTEEQRMLNGQAIKADFFQMHKARERNHNKNLYFSNFALPLSPEEYRQKEIREKVQNEYKEKFEEKMKNFGHIQSIFVKVNPNNGELYAFVCFDNEQDAEKALYHFSSVETDLFGTKLALLVNKQKSDEELGQQPHYPQKNDDRYMYVKNLKQNADEETITKAFQQYGKIESVRIGKHKHYSDTIFATIKFEQPAVYRQVLKDCRQRKGKFDQQDFKDLFNTKPFVCKLMPREDLDKHQREQIKKKQFTPEQQQQQFDQRNQFRFFPPFPMLPFNPYQMFMPNMNPNFQQQRRYPHQQFRQNRPFNQQNMQQQQFVPRQNYNRPFQQQSQNRTYRFQQNNNQFRQQPHNFQQRQNFPQNNNMQQNQYPNQQQMYQPKAQQPNLQQGVQQNFNPQMINQQQQQQQQQQQYQPRVPYQQYQQGQRYQQQGMNQPQNQFIQQQYQQQRPIQPQMQHPQQMIQPQQIQWNALTIRQNLENFKKMPPSNQRGILGSLTFPIVQKLVSQDMAPQVGKITGILVDLSQLSVEDILEFLETESVQKERITDAEELLRQQ